MGHLEAVQNSAYRLPGSPTLGGADVSQPEMTIRLLAHRDASVLATAFADDGWEKPEELFTGYLDDQERGERLCWLARVGSSVAGYATLSWVPQYHPLRAAGLPEIQDLNVLAAFRRRGIASGLIEVAEREAATRVDEVGIGVGLHPGYRAAQRLYPARGYVPDGHGVTYRDEPVAEGVAYPFDDDLVLHLTKRLRN
jgi:GNAT superfamily N-acetyltransferase